MVNVHSVQVVVAVLCNGGLVCMSYLDISISICGGKYVTEVYDKRDDFNIDIVNFPYNYV